MSFWICEILLGLALLNACIALYLIRVAREFQNGVKQDTEDQRF